MPERKVNISHRAEDPAQQRLCREHRFPLTLRNRSSLFKHTLKHGKPSLPQRHSEYETRLEIQTVSRVATNTLWLTSNCTDRERD